MGNGRLVEEHQPQVILEPTTGMELRHLPVADLGRRVEGKVRFDDGIVDGAGIGAYAGNIGHPIIVERGDTAERLQVARVDVTNGEFQRDVKYLPAEHQCPLTDINEPPGLAVTGHGLEYGQLAAFGHDVELVKQRDARTELVLFAAFEMLVERFEVAEAYPQVDRTPVGVAEEGAPHFLDLSSALRALGLYGLGRGHDCGPHVLHTHERTNLFEHKFGLEVGRRLRHRE